MLVLSPILRFLRLLLRGSELNLMNLKENCGWDLENIHLLQKMLKSEHVRIELMSFPLTLVPQSLFLPYLNCSVF